MVAAGGPPERTSISFNLQACISELARIIRQWTLDFVRRFLLFSRGAGIARGTGEDTAVKVAETAEKESPPAEDDCNQQQHADDNDDWRDKIDYFAKCETEDEASSNSDSDYDSDDGIDRNSSPPSTRICYDGDNANIRKAYSFSRYLVELLAVRPRFYPFVGTFAVIGPNISSMYYSDSSSASAWRRGRNLDSWGDLIIHARGRAIEDRFHIQVRIPEDDDEGGLADFTVDPYACNRVIIKTITTRRGRKIDVTFMALHKAIQADVRVTLVDFVSGTASTVYGEIAGHHELFDDKRVVLFSRQVFDEAEVAENGEVPLSRRWVAVPIYLEPLLVIKLNLRVPTSPDGEGEGRTIHFRGNLTFYRDEYEKVICSSGDGHGKVKVKISYPWY